MPNTFFRLNPWRAANEDANADEQPPNGRSAMVRMIDIPEETRPHIANLACPVYEGHPFVSGPPVKQRRVAVISTAGLQRRDDRPYAFDANDYRIIPGDTPASDIVMSHISSNFDRSGFQQDYNIAFPLDRLREMAGDGEIGSVADYHYSFMGSTHPDQMEDTARHLAGLLKGDKVDVVVLIPV
jgi:D-proline reductase (dithiol) PrdB